MARPGFPNVEQIPPGYNPGRDERYPVQADPGTVIELFQYRNTNDTQRDPRAIERKFRQYL